MMKGCDNMKLGDCIFEYSQRNKEDKNYPVYSVTNTLGFCQEYFSKDVSGKDKTTYKLVPRGYFAYNPSRINVGSVDWQKSENCVIVSPLYVVFGLKDTLKPEYLKYYLKSKPINELIRLSTSGTVRDNLKYSSLEKFPIPVPSIKEQTAICSLLDKLSLVIEKKKQQMKELDNLAQAIFYDMFGDPVENEKGWKVKKMGDMCNTITKGTTPTTLGYSFASEVINFVKVESFNDGKIDTSKLTHITKECHDALSRSQLDDLDLLVCIAGATIGKTAVVDKSILPANTNQACAIVRLKNKGHLAYIQNYLMSKFKNDVEQMGKGVAQPNLSLGQMRDLSIPLPPLSLQQSFAQKVESIERQKELINQSIREAQTLFDSRMEYYFGE